MSASVMPTEESAPSTSTVVDGKAQRVPRLRGGKTAVRRDVVPSTVSG